MAQPPLPPFDAAAAALKARRAEDAWNRRDPARVAIEAFIQRKWAREHEHGNRVNGCEGDFGLG